MSKSQKTIKQQEKQEENKKLNLKFESYDDIINISEKEKLDDLVLSKLSYIIDCMNLDRLFYSDKYNNDINIFQRNLENNPICDIGSGSDRVNIGNDIENKLKFNYKTHTRIDDNSGSIIKSLVLFVNENNTNLVIELNQSTEELYMYTISSKGVSKPIYKLKYERNFEKIKEYDNANTNANRVKPEQQPEPDYHKTAKLNLVSSVIHNSFVKNFMPIENNVRYINSLMDLEDIITLLKYIIYYYIRNIIDINDYVLNTNRFITLDSYINRLNFIISNSDEKNK